MYRRMTQKRKSFKLIIAVALIMLILCLGLAFKMMPKIKSLIKKDQFNDSNVAKAMSYEELDENEYETQSEFVKFAAFYTKDLDNDGYAEKYKGTSIKIGSSDTLYLDLNVFSNGILKNGKITINAKNFYFNTALVKDQIIAEDYISSNTREIKLNDIESGNQRLIMGQVRSGSYSNGSLNDVIGLDTNNYSCDDNTVTLTGLFVADDGTEIPINKTITLKNDWYGITKADLKSNRYSYLRNQDYIIDTALDEENRLLKMHFMVYPEETASELIISKNHTELTLPEINGFYPSRIYTKEENNIESYDSENNIFTIEKEATLTQEGTIQNSVSRSLSYEVYVEYPIEAFENDSDRIIILSVPVRTWYEGYNNPNREFDNPYRSNTAQDTLSIVYKADSGESRTDLIIGEGIWDEFLNRTIWVISKELPINLYNNVTETSEEDDEVIVSPDRYKTRWNVFTGRVLENKRLTFKETPTNDVDEFLDDSGNYTRMDDYVSYAGIYFSGLESAVGDAGNVSVFDDDTNTLIKTFTKEEWSMYSESNPYMYSDKVKHIRVETTEVSKNSSIQIINIKEIDDVKIKADFTEEEFEKLSYIYSWLSVYDTDSGQVVGSDIEAAEYMMPYSDTNISISPTYISSQNINENFKIEISTKQKNITVKKWQNGIFLLEYPEEILFVEVNDIVASKNTTVIGKNTYFENGRWFTIIYTSNDSEQNVTLEVDANIASDPRRTTTQKPIKLYAYNPGCHNYYKHAREKDLYDINGNQDTDENMSYRYTNLTIISPSNLLTAQTASDYNDLGEISIAPQIAEVNKSDGTRTARINVSVVNNYQNTISEVKIVGKIPFEGNTYQLSQNKNLGSTYSSTMTPDGISVPREISEFVTIYYSEEEQTNNDLNDSTNRWTLKENVSDWTKIKTYLIDFGEYVIPKDVSQIVSYQVIVPADLDYNEVAYSIHGVYYCLDTENGKLRTQTEPTKLGIMIAEKYNLKIVKYQTNSDFRLQGIVFKCDELTDGVVTDEKTATSDEEGLAILKNLYVGRTYRIKEIKTDINHILDDREVVLTSAVVDDTVNVQIISGNFDSGFTIEKVENSNTVVSTSKNNEVKYNISMDKLEEADSMPIQGIRFMLEDQSGNKSYYTTNLSGKIYLRLLIPNVEYTLTEIDTRGHYLKEPVRFVMRRDADLNLDFNILSGSFAVTPTIDETNIVPTVNAKLTNEKIPTYTLHITKKEAGEENLLAGTQFTVTGDNKNANTIYTTDENGELVIDDLYEYVSTKPEITGVYTLKEIYPTEGYVVTEAPIVFKAERNSSGSLEFNLISGTIREGSLTVDNATSENPIINITIDNEPIFSLQKVDKDTGEPIAGVQFKITDWNGRAVRDVNGNSVDRLVTDENGRIRVGLSEGLYKAWETAAPEGYKIPDSSQYNGIGIGTGREAQLDYEIQWETFEKCYNSLQSIINLNNNEKIIVSNTELMKINGNLEILWRKSFYKDYKIGIKEVKKYGSNLYVLTTNNKIIILNEEADYAGEIDTGFKTISRFEVIDDGFLIKYNTTLYKYDWYFNEIWEKTYEDDAEIIIGNYIIAYGNQSVKKYDFDLNLLDSLYLLDEYDCGSSREIYYINDHEFAVSLSSNYLRMDLNFENRVQYGVAGNGNWAVWSILAIGDDYAYVIDSYYGRISKYDLAGNYIERYNMSNQIRGETNTSQEYLKLSCFGNDILILGGYNQPNLIEEFCFDNNNNVNKRQIDYYNYNYNSVSSLNDGVVVTTKEKIIKFDVDGNLLIEKNASYSKVYSDKITELVGVYSNMLYGLDSNLEEIWNTEIEGATNIYNIRFDANNIYVCCKIGNLYDIIKLDYSGNIISMIEDIKTTIFDVGANNGKIYTGRTIYNSGGVDTGVLSVYSSETGELENNTEFPVRTYSGNSNRSIYDAVALDESVVLCTGNAGGGVVFQFDLEGNFIKENKEKTNGLTSFEQMAKVNDGFVAITNVYTAGDTDSIVKYDKEANFSTVTPYLSHLVFESVVSDCDGNLYVISSSGSNSPGTLLKYVPHIAEPEIVPSQSIVVENEIAKYNITTKVEGIGGTISGMNQKPYEEVVYKKNSIKDIIATPYSGYKVEKITVNGEKIDFLEQPDGTVLLDKFISVTEDKEVVVYFVRETSLLNIKKVDAKSKEPLDSALFNIREIDERDELTQEDKNRILNLNFVNDDTYYFVNNNGTYSSNNQGYHSTIAHSYFTVDLENYNGPYDLKLDYKVSSEASFDIGSIIITNNPNKPTYDASAQAGRALFVSGNRESSLITVLNGGSKYYVHVFYRKDGSASSYNDSFEVKNIDIINSVNGLYNENISTNGNGEIRLTTSARKLKITEKEAPEGYTLNTTPIIHEMSNVASENVIEIENVHKTDVIVHHYKKGTTTKLADDETITGDIGSDYSTAPKTDIPYYTIAKKADGSMDLPENRSGTFSTDTIEVFYYYDLADLSLTVHHFIDGTQEKVVEDEHFNGKLNEEYETHPAAPPLLDSKYELVESKIPLNASGIYEEDGIEVVYYYRIKDSAGVIVHHVNIENDEPIAEDDILTGKVGDRYTTKVSDGVPKNYKFERRTDNYEGDFGEEIIEVTYYYGIKTPNVNPSIEKTADTDTVTALDQKITYNVKYEDNISEYIGNAIVRVIDYLPYKIDLEKSDIANGIYDQEQNTLTWELRYAGIDTYENGAFTILLEKELKLVYLDIDTAQDSVLNRVVGKTILDNPENETTVNKVLDIPERIPGKVTVYYKNKANGQPISEEVSHIGIVGEDFDVTDDEKDIEGWIMIEPPSNKKGQYTVADQVKEYWYARITRVTTHYIDLITEREIEEPTIEDGYELKPYDTIKKSFDGYKFEYDSGNIEGTMTVEPIDVYYYYKHYSAGVLEKHIDVISGELLFDDITTGMENEHYKILPKTFPGYDLVESRLPDNAEGEMKRELITVTYYYHKKTKVISRYLDRLTLQPIETEETIQGHENDDYNTIRKNINDYVLVEVPENADGKMTAEDITVTYYYKHTSGGVIVNHYDDFDKKQLKDEEKIDGYEGDPYETHEEEFENYDLVREKYPLNSKGNMTKTEERVNYYYKYKSKVTVKYIDKETNEEIEELIEIPGHEGDEYYTSPKEIDGFDLVEEPENRDGIMPKGEIELVYYYRRPAKVIVHHIDIETEEEIADEEIIEGHENDNYETKEQIIKYYKLVREKYPDNSKGKMIVEKVKPYKAKKEKEDEDEDDIDASLEGEEEEYEIIDVIYVTYYYRKLSFNLSVDKRVNTVRFNGNSYLYNNDIAKFEFNKRYLDSANIEVLYSVIIKNTGELPGKAIIVENIPSGMKMDPTKNYKWTIEDGSAKMNVDILYPGEELKFDVILEYEPSNIKLGDSVNTVILNDIENEADYKEVSIKDNKADADMVLLISTGKEENKWEVLMTICIWISIIPLVVFLVKKKKS